MRKCLAGIWMCLLLAVSCVAQDAGNAIVTRKAKGPHQSRAFVQMYHLLDLGWHYLRKPGEERNDLDSALLLGRQAAEMGRRLKDAAAVEEAGLLLGSIHSEAKEFIKAEALLPGLTDTTRISLLLIMAQYKANTDGATQEDKRKAGEYCRHALALSDSIHSHIYRARSDMQLMTVVDLDTASIKQYLSEAFDIFRKNGDLEDECQIMEAINGYCLNGKNMQSAYQLFQGRLLEDYKKLTAPAEVERYRKKLISLLVEAAAYSYFGKLLDQSEGEYLMAIQLDRAGTPVNIWPYCNLAYLYSYEGKYEKALQYALEANRIEEKNPFEEKTAGSYIAVGKIYLELDKPKQAWEFLEPGLALAIRKKLATSDGTVGSLHVYAARALLKMHQPEKAMQVLDDAPRYFELDNFTKGMLLQGKGDCYAAGGELEKSEKAYVSAIEVLSHDRFLFRRLRPYRTLGELYIRMGRYDKAVHYLEVLISDSSKAAFPLNEQRDVALLLFRADSAAGNYMAAIRHLQLSKALNDSIFNTTKNKQVEELRVQYQTEKKDQDIQLLTNQGQLQASRMEEQRLQFQIEGERKEKQMTVLGLEADKKDKDLQLVRLSAEKKDRDIQLLHNETALQEVSLQQARYSRNMLIGGAVLLLLVLGLVYNRYRLKRRSNQLLQEQQEKINRTNMRLQQLVQEKEWLIREIHHRVKNNLQIVMSLLNMQSHYLDDEYALGAFDEASHRMQAIALIHQKLYQTEGMTTINMADYIRELVSYLRETSAGGTAGNIRFDLQVEPVELDVSQSVPVGLILNEAITNAIKYAFPDRGRGSIRVLLQEREDGIYLTVADDGKGLPPLFDKDRQDSMGFQLMDVLTEQLEGDMILENSPGLSLTVRFRATPTL